MTEDYENNRKKNGRIEYMLIVFGCLCVFGLAMFVGVTLFQWISDLEDKETITTSQSMQQSEDNISHISAEDLVDNQWKLPESAKEEPVYTQAEVQVMIDKAREEAGVAAREAMVAELEMQLDNGSTIVEAMRKCFADRLVLASSGKYYFLPIRNDLAHNKYDKDKLVKTEDGELLYMEKDKVISHKGIDVSKFQGKIDWEKVAADGIEFAIIRIGYRGYGGTGKLVVDDTFRTNLEGAQKAGLKTGVYIYSQAINDEEIEQEVQLILEQLEGFELKGPVVFDVEKVTGANGRMNDLTVEERTRLTKLFCDKIKKAGYKPMIYHNMEMGLLMLDLTKLKSYDKWFAYYHDDFYYPYEYDIWQYTDKGTVDGIKGDVDINIAFKLWDE